MEVLTPTSSTVQQADDPSSNDFSTSGSDDSIGAPTQTLPRSYERYWQTTLLQMTDWMGVYPFLAESVAQQRSTEPNSVKASSKSKRIEARSRLGDHAQTISNGLKGDRSSYNSLQLPAKELAREIQKKDKTAPRKKGRKEVTVTQAGNSAPSNK